VTGVCLFVAGALVASLPDPAFTLVWTHSVQQTRWVERYRVEGSALRLVDAEVEGSGAGMEPPADAVLRDGRWHWRADRLLAELVLVRSAYARDYEVCTASGCRALGALAGPASDDRAVAFRPCAARAPRGRRRQRATGGNSVGACRRSSDETRSGNAPSLRSRK
jgi:hypothetical protein